MGRLIIFGAGEIGKRVYLEVLLGEIGQKDIFYYDNDTKKQGTCINGVLVLTYEQFIEMLHVGNCEIILATDYWKELLKFCSDICVEDKVVGVYNAMNLAHRPYAALVYGQDAEETYLSEKIGEKYGCGYKCFYVDVGAHHPYRFSNTYWAYTRGGAWHQYRTKCRRNGAVY